MNRYFLVFLNGVNPDGNISFASCTTQTSNGRYLTQTGVLDTVKNTYPDCKFCITNIIELSESDYNDYIKSPN